MSEALTVLSALPSLITLFMVLQIQKAKPTTELADLTKFMSTLEKTIEWV
jgi:hypothetical protein